MFCQKIQTDLELESKRLLEVMMSFINVERYRTISMRYNHPDLRLGEIQQTDSSFKFCQNISPEFCLRVNQTYWIIIELFVNQAQLFYRG